jgi:hypothetical protein
MPIKPEEAIELLQFIGIDPDKTETIDAAKDKFGADFILKSEAIKDDAIASKIVGSRMGALETEAKRTFKEIGVEFEGEEIKGKKLEDILKLGASKVKEQFEQIKKLNTGGDEATKEWEKKYNAQAKKLNDTQTLANTLQEQYASLEGIYKTEKKQAKLTDYKKSQIADIKLKSDINTLMLDGFHANIEKKYAIDFDEKDEPFVIDRATNSRIQSKKNAGKFADFGEVFELEAAANKLIAESPHGGKPIFVPKPTQTPPQTTAPSNVSDRARRMVGGF